MWQHNRYHSYRRCNFIDKHRQEKARKEIKPPDQISAPQLSVIVNCISRKKENTGLWHAFIWRNLDIVSPQRYNVQERRIPPIWLFTTVRIISSFSHIRFLGAEPAIAETYYEKKSMRDREARRAYRQTKRTADAINELYILDIMREGIKNGDPRLR